MIWNSIFFAFSCCEYALFLSSKICHYDVFGNVRINEQFTIYIIYRESQQELDLKHKRQRPQEQQVVVQQADPDRHRQQHLHQDQDQHQDQVQVQHQVVHLQVIQTWQRVECHRDYNK